ncbi:NAD(P)/FAD-dependent oxidoreductase [Leekyejoonella antrihumi]|uniref:NADH:ubiquinone reductase (non-electrogenic) n=1 Tax=Leekyejoonella antrihumi TaxID=1660198 RepID=A0A563E968_9MICO|nr:NAD(P)/FAD-dependent oxidoreductase [Leekyejoonella antrihumi]TWP39037.1 NAD(P)/FAD-dependent oxidoreductase [Leekyejoonella antrihumi]
MSTTTHGTGQRPHVVVIGGGFGGLAAVHALRHADVDITLVDQHPYNTFQPLLYQVATATLNPGDVTWFLRSVRSRQRNVWFVQGAVKSMDHHTRMVSLDNDTDLTYDYLVLANGVTANFFGIQGAAENAMPLYTRTHALKLRDTIFASLEDAALNHPGQDVRVVIVGGGATGVETAGALAEMRNKDLPVLYPELDPKHVHVTLVEMADHPLAAFSKGSQDYAREALGRRGVDLKLDTKVREVRRDGVVVGDDAEFLPAGVVIWASGITVDDSVSQWGLPQGKGGRIKVDDQLRVEGMQRVYAVGDVAIGEGDLALPQLAQPALQGGKHAGKAIAADLEGASIKPFTYLDKGILATIGRSSAVAEVAHFPRLQGFPAWVIWNAVHITTLLGNRNRAAAMVNLGAKYLAWGRSHNAIVGDTPKAIAQRVK